MKNKRSKASMGIIFNLAMILVFILGPVNVEPAKVFAETPQEQPPLEGLAISQGEWMNDVIPEGGSLHFPLNVADPHDGEAYYWEITHPLPLGQVSVSPLGDQTVVAYQALKGYLGEDVFTVQVSTSTGERAKINVVISIAQQVDERAVPDRHWEEPVNPQPPRYDEKIIESRYELENRWPDLLAGQDDLEQEYLAGQREMDQPYMYVYPQDDYVIGYGWLPDTPITLSINGREWTEQSESWGYVYFYLENYDIQPGDLLVMTDGVDEIQYTVSNLAILEFDEVNDIISGKGSQNNQIDIRACDSLACHTIQTQIDEFGDWQADFSGVMDIGPGVTGYVFEYDPGRNSTRIFWNIPNPRITVYPIDDYVMGVDWPPFTEITLRIGEKEWTEFSEPSGYVNFMDLYFDIQAGHEIWMSDGDNVKTYVVSILAITEFDEDNDVIYGIGGDNQQITIEANNNDEWGSKVVEADSNGDWVADFSGLVDIGPGVSGWVYEVDEAGNRTEFYWYLPDPNLIVQLTDFYISGYQWPQNTLVTLTIDGQLIDSQDSGNSGAVSFHVYEYNLQPGQEVILSGGEYTRTHVIRYIAVTEVDQENDLVRGTADPLSTVNVTAYDVVDWSAFYRSVEADESGIWQADFSGEFNITRDTLGYLDQYDEQGNKTMISWYVPDPYIVVNLNEKSIGSFNWPQNTLVSLSIDGEFIQSRNITPWGDVWFFLSTFDLHPGQVVVLSGGGFTRTHVIRHITVIDIDQENNIVSGIGDPGMVLQLYAAGETTWGWDEVTVDQDGTWHADFAGDVDITKLAQGWVRAYDEEGNYTHIFWYIPDPNFSVFLNDNQISGYLWPENTMVSLTINDQLVQINNTSPWGDVWFNLSGFDLQPGQELVLSGGGFTRTHIVRNIAVTDIDQVNDLVLGIADPLSTVNVTASDPVTWNGGFISIAADESGQWLADFSGQVDISKGTTGQVTQYDEEGNRSEWTWFVPDPYIYVGVYNNYVGGYRWKPNVSVKLSIDSIEIASATVQKNGGVYIYLGDVNIQPGQEVVLSGGGDTRTHIVRNIAITEIDQANSIVRGTADPHSPVGVTAETVEDGWTYNWRDVVADGEGNWVADFSSESNFSAGTYGNATQADENGNITEIRWFIPDPYFQVYLTSGYVIGYEWTPNSPVTLTVDGVERGTGISNDSGRVFIGSAQPFLPGQIVVLDDGLNTRTHIVKDITVTEINQDSKFVSGTAQPSSEIDVSAHDGSNYQWLTISVDESGTWLANFAPYAVNFTEGTYGWASQYDDKGNSTNVRWYIPNPVMEVSLLGNSVFGRDWGPLTNITLLIDGSEVAQQSSNASGTVHFSSGSMEINPGMVITLTDGKITRTHIVRDISVTAVDLENDTISGTADPDSWVQVIASSTESFDILSVQADASRTWLADFFGKVDIKAGASGNVTQYDSQGNATATSWFVPDPYITVSLNMNSIYGRQWPPDTQVTLSIGGDSWTETSNVFGNVLFQPDSFLIEPGQQLTLTGGGYTVAYTVSYIVITGIDTVADTVSGLADPDSTIYIYACSGGYYCEMLSVLVDGSGNWEADFSGKIDLIPGSFGEVWQNDGGRNSTYVGWQVNILKITSADSATFIAGQAGTFTITTTGFPVPTISYTGSLPAGVTLIDNGDGTATLSGTPESGTGRSYSLRIFAKNDLDPDDFQEFTLEVLEAPTITSADGASFTVGQEGTFTIETTGNPDADISIVGSLPEGIAFKDQDDGTATLSGTPSAGTGGIFLLTITASNGITPDAEQLFTVTISETMVITSADNVTITAGQAGTFTIETAGFPYPDLSSVGALPEGITFADQEDGTATLSGTPAAGTGGVYLLMITASNGDDPEVTQNFTLTVNEAPTITSEDHTSFTVGQAGTFTFETAGFPISTLSHTGNLPGGIILVDNENGTATLSGTPAVESGGVYTLTITAINGVTPNAEQAFTLTVNEALSITSADNTSFSVGQAGTFTIETTGFPYPDISIDGHLPEGINFEDQDDGTATLSGTPAAGTGGVYLLMITASNGITGDETQPFTLTIDETLAITSADNTTFTAGQAGSFTIETIGFPYPEISIDGDLPAGVIFADQDNGTATLSGTPEVGSGGVYTLTITASNGVDLDADQNFTLTVNEAPTITGDDFISFTVGQAGTFIFETTGYPVPAISRTGSLPGGVTFVDNENGTAILSGMPAAGSGGVYTLTITASNGVTPYAEQSFTLTVYQAPAITSGSSKIFTVGTPGVFLITTSGYPTPTISSSGGLPAGITFEDTGDGIAVLYGTPAAASGGDYAITITASNTVEPPAVQAFTIFIAGFSGCQDDYTISLTECEALVSLYENNGGQNWRFKNNWLITDDPGNWYGVTVEGGHVTELDLTSNNLTGELAPQFFSLTGLTHLTLTDNRLSGLISPAFGSLTNLVYLDLQANKFTGGIPDEIGQLANLKELWLTTNELTGSIPAAITNLSGLEALGLGRNKFTGEIPAQISDLGGLKYLFLDGNQWTGNFPASLASLTGLESLSLRNNQLSGAIPEDFANLIHLSYLALDYNRLTVPAEPEALAAFLDEKNPGWDLTQAKVGTVDSTNTFTSPDQKTEISVEPDSYDEVIVFTFIPQPEPTQTTGSFGFAGNSFQLTAMVGEQSITGQLVVPFTARIYYDPDNLGTIEEDSLTLYYWNEDQSLWMDVLVACSGGEYVRNFDENWFEVPICHLSEFSVLGEVAPTFTSSPAVTFAVAEEKTFTILAPAYPDPTMRILTGSLPAGISFIDNEDGTATLAGTPAAGTGGIYQLTIEASNGINPDAVQVLTITVREKPSITSGNSDTVTEGQPVSFTVESSGLPLGSFSFAGTLPDGVSITDQGNGTALLSGTPVRGSAGTFKFSITAVNEVGVSPVQSFTLEVLPGEDDDGGYKIYLPLILK